MSEQIMTPEIPTAQPQCADLQLADRYELPSSSVTEQVEIRKSTLTSAASQ